MQSIIRTMAAAAVIGITSVSLVGTASAAAPAKKKPVKCHVIKGGKKVWTTKCAANGKPGANGVGVNGKDGAAGANGSNGVNGAAGANGLDGAKGETGSAGSNGTNGAAGGKGDTGAPGADSKVAGPRGASAFDIWLTFPANEGRTVEDFMKSLIGERGKTCIEELGKDACTGKQGERGEQG